MHPVFLRLQPPVPEEVEEALALHHAAHQFRQEVNHRQEVEQHCQWYEQLAERHQQELAAMAQEPDILAWFRGIWR